MIDEAKWNHVVNGTPALRKAILELEPMLFAIYYFPEYFTFAIPPFHMDFYEDCKDIASGKIDEVMWCVFRDGAKTSVAKIALMLWIICFVKKRYINWDSYDGDNAESALFDITVALQTNKRLIKDFGQLYHKRPSKNELSEAKMKRIKNFITEESAYGKGVRVSAFTTQESTRGRLYGSIRPDLFIFDDFENMKTIDSFPVTKKIIDHINELRAGLSAGTGVLYLCNYLSDSGSVAHVMENLRENPRARVRFIPIINEKGEIAWKAKYVMTDSEAYEVNRKIEDPKKHKISIESKKKSLSKDGLVFETEMMLNPSKSGNLFFDRDKVNAALAKCKDPIESNVDLKIWAKFDPRHRYGMGADTAEGIGADANASTIIDFTQVPNLVVATFEDAHMSNTTLGWELKRQGALYGYPYLVPELNNTGYGTIAELKNAEYPHIYIREVKNKVAGTLQKEYGWKATTGTKFEVMGNFKNAFESGELEILDKGLLTEMKFITKNDARITSKQDGATRHFDKLRSAALAWEARNFATYSSEEKSKKFSVPDQDKPYIL